MKKWLLIIALIFTTALTHFSIWGEESKKVVLVLGSGGSKALAHIGVIEELENLGVIPDVIVGCSSGAIVGALYAQEQDIAKVKEILINLKSQDLVDFTLFQKNALSKRNKLEDFLKQHLTVTDFSALKIPFIAVATDLDIGEPAYLAKNELHPAVLASCALPGLFPPYKMGDYLYVDGGVSDPLPIHFAHGLENAIVIASDVSEALDGFSEDNLFELLNKSFQVLYHRLAYSARSEADILLAMNFRGIDSTIDDDENHRMYRKGKCVVQMHAEEILKKVPIARNKKGL